MHSLKTILRRVKCPLTPTPRFFFAQFNKRNFSNYEQMNTTTTSHASILSNATNANFNTLNTKANDTESKETISTEVDANTKLDNFRISAPMRDHLISQGIATLFPIQAATFDHIFEEKDLIGRDTTGSGKTLGYVLPLVENFRAQGLFRNKSGQKPLVLVVLPTRELVIQVTGVFEKMKMNQNEYRTLSIYGGTDISNQIYQLKRGVDIVIGTPGRLLDLIERGEIGFTDLKTIVLDEADQMLDMGFQEDIEKIYEAVHEVVDKKGLQSILYSATLPHWVHEVSRKYLRENELVKVDLVKEKGYKVPTTAKHLAINCHYSQRNEVIADIVLCYGGEHARTIIFTETKKEANDIMLEAQIKQECQVLHGDIPQNQREITFRAFREGKFKCLIATNVAARGLDIPDVDLIVQLSPPGDVDTYIHRAGRTARAGRSGVCVTFYTNRELEIISRIEKQASFKFQKVGPPQPADVIKASSRDIVTSIQQVPHEVVGLFDEITEELLNSLGAKEALARALAIISGTNQKSKQRSLLSSKEGFITYLVEFEEEIRSTGAVWGILKKNFSADVTDEIKTMKAFVDKKGAAFDLPEEHQEEFEKFIDELNPEDGVTFTRAHHLPELEDFSSDRRGGSDRRYGSMDRRYGSGDRRSGSGSYGREGRSTFTRGDSSSYGRDGREGREGREGRSNFSRGDSRSSKGGREELKVYVGGLNYDVQVNDLANFFEKQGFNPVDTYIPSDKDGNSRGFGFVTFGSKDEARSATQINGKRFKGRSLRVDLASERPEK